MIWLNESLGESAARRGVWNVTFRWCVGSVVAINDKAAFGDWLLWIETKYPDGFDAADNVMSKRSSYGIWFVVRTLNGPIPDSDLFRAPIWIGRCKLPQYDAAVGA